MPSCKLYQLDAAASVKFLAPVLERLKSQGSLRYAELPDEKKTPLKVYFLESQKNEFGEMYSFELDEEIKLWSREQGEYSVSATVPIRAQFFAKDLSPLVCVFASRFNAVAFEEAMHRLCAAEIFLPIAFNLTEKSEAIRTNFVDVQGFRIEQLRDDKEKRASVGGTRLQSSGAWERYVTRMRGELVTVIVKVNGSYVRMASDGMLRFQAADDDVRLVRNLILELKRLGVM